MEIEGILGMVNPHADCSKPRACRVNASVLAALRRRSVKTMLTTEQLESVLDLSTLFCSADPLAPRPTINYRREVASHPNIPIDFVRRSIAYLESTPRPIVSGPARPTYQLMMVNRAVELPDALRIAASPHYWDVGALVKVLDRPGVTRGDADRVLANPRVRDHYEHVLGEAYSHGVEGVDFTLPEWMDEPSRNRVRSVSVMSAVLR